MGTNQELAAAWDEGVAYARAELRRQFDLENARLRRFPKPMNNSVIQPCFDAINAAGSMSYGEYNAHIASVHLWSAIESLTVHPEMPDGEGGVFEADEDPNPYRSTQGAGDVQG